MINEAWTGAQAVKVKLDSWLSPHPSTKMTYTFRQRYLRGARKLNSWQRRLGTGQCQKRFCCYFRKRKVRVSPPQRPASAVRPPHAIEAFNYKRTFPKTKIYAPVGFPIPRLDPGAKRELAQLLECEEFFWLVVWPSSHHFTGEGTRLDWKPVLGTVRKVEQLPSWILGGSKWVGMFQLKSGPGCGWISRSKLDPLWTAVVGLQHSRGSKHTTMISLLRQPRTSITFSVSRVCCLVRKDKLWAWARLVP